MRGSRGSESTDANRRLAMLWGDGDLIAIRHKYPAIARGTYTAISGGHKNLGGFKIEYEGKTLYLIHNTSGESLTLGVSGYAIAALCDSIGMGAASLENSILTVGPQTSVILE